MRVRAETLLIIAMAVFGLLGWFAIRSMASGVGPAPIPVTPVTAPAAPGPAVTVDPPSGRAWFRDVRGFCNPVDVTTRLRWQPAPDAEEGRMYEAACYALAGKIDLARASIEALPADRRYTAAGVVFEVGHPAADGGDELAAGPLMELVVEFWPNHYMALYHAGAAAFERGEHEAARDYLTRFLQEYAAEDSWRSDAVSMLEAIDG